nr:unnamed protein product [Timema californicum]
MREKPKLRNTNSVSFVDALAHNIYLNEHLTASNRKKFAEARKQRDDGKFAFVWLKNGRIYIREEEGKPAVLYNEGKKWEDDVDAFMSLDDNAGDVDKVLKRLDEQHSKYKFMEYNLLSKRRRLKLQIPELENSLDMIKFLQKQSGSTKEIEMQYMLSDQVYVKAVVPPTDKVCLWLGANVMLEYTLADALNLLTNNIQSAKKNLNYVEHDLDFLRDQFTTTEVNMARVYNWDVKRRQAAKASS